MLFAWATTPLSPWQKINGSNEAWLAEQRSLTRPSQFARQFENKFVSSEVTLLTDGGADWDACIKLSAPQHSNPMVPVFVGIDASTKRDSTAVVVVSGEKDDVILRDHKIFQPTGNSPVNFQEVEDYLLAIKKKYPLCTLVYDQYQLVSMMQRLSKWGLKVEEFIQNLQNLSAATQCLFDLIRYQRLQVYPDSKLRDAIIHTIVEEKTTGFRIVKNASDKNDIVLALAMAAYRCTQRHNKRVDLNWKYRAFAPDFVDEDQPPVEQQPEPAPRGNPSRDIGGSTRRAPIKKSQALILDSKNAARDAEAGVWYIADSDLPGLNLEGESLDELYDKLFHGIEELTGEPKVEFELVVLGRRWPALV